MTPTSTTEAAAPTTPAAAARPPLPRWQRRKDARPGEILDAALDVFVRQGFAATRIHDLAQQAGVTTGTVYLYFPSKEAVFHAAVMHAMSPFLALCEKRVSAFEGSSEALLGDMLRHWWRIVTEDPRYAGIPRLIGAEADRFPELACLYVTEVLGRARAMFARVLQRGVDRGEFRALDVERAARLAMAPLQYAFAYNSSLAKFDRASAYDRGYVDAHIDTFVRGIRAKAPRA